MEDKQKFISLKEAAQISGYASDYIGQLIRQGKLPGKQVWSSVAWMTTEDAIRDYVANERNPQASRRQTPSDIPWLSAGRGILYSVIVLSAGFTIFLFFLLSVQLDKRWEQKTIQKVGLEGS